MPLISLETLAGPGSFHYTVSTPTKAHADAIVPGIPTLVMLHPVYIASPIFHPIFADARLRRFNLVTFDLRGHGGTTACVEDTYVRETAARDALRLMEALKLPACHLMGVSMGACIALQMAVLAPEKVLSIFMLSALPLVEPPEAAEGRQEIWDCWVAAFEDPHNVDDAAIKDAVVGALQLAYNNRETTLSRALVSQAIPDGLKNWAPGNFEAFHTVSVKFFLNRAPHPVSRLSRIACPIALIHCSDDVAYPIHYSEELLDLLQNGGIDARIHRIEGAPHFGNVTHWKETNALLYEFLLANSKGAGIPPLQPNVESPFLTDLIQFGLRDKESDSDSDSESD
ncbi:Alpha/Beta hydrolase protein [Mycena galericulata]|nr:Alpha/Beta hydrolase protein [Mycena galericulata]